MGFWYPCCAAESPPCNGCTVDAPTVIVTPYGFADGSCGCAGLNGTGYVLTQSDQVCNWNLVDTLSCGGAPTPLVFNLWNTYFFGRRSWNLTIYIGDSWWWFIWDSGSSAPFDCTVQRTAALYLNYDPAGRCGSGSEYCLVN